jgi:hypothetical protein
VTEPKRPEDWRPGDPLEPFWTDMLRRVHIRARQLGYSDDTIKKASSMVFDAAKRTRVPIEGAPEGMLKVFADRFLEHAIRGEVYDPFANAVKLKREGGPA